MKQVGIFGKRKSGKSALMYALTKQKIIQDAAFSAMEISGITRVMLVDTVGVDVEGSTAEESAQSVEVALMLITDDSFELELAWISKLRKAGSSIIVVISQADKFPDGGQALAAAVREVSGLKTFCVSSQTGAGVIELDEEINRLLGSRD
ncbi:MAG: 50S ribosome-binding GTPase [Selenomonadaceae bacterium]|nr:50S ribosome-binding GTPase [Selenomonadaceae bacterium]MBQ7723029.1 50S ribosome-binding GTPase [Selenomonadaceae bacterium]